MIRGTNLFSLSLGCQGTQKRTWAWDLWTASSQSYQTWVVNRADVWVYVNFGRLLGIGWCADVSQSIFKRDGKEYETKTSVVATSFLVCNSFMAPYSQCKLSLFLCTIKLFYWLINDVFQFIFISLIVEDFDILYLVLVNRGVKTRLKISFLIFHI